MQLYWSPTASQMAILMVMTRTRSHTRRLSRNCRWQKQGWRRWKCAKADPQFVQQQQERDQPLHLISKRQPQILIM
jgi:hypothetical protein